ncbi:hypothetical protein GE09DRAFT_588733 [Coniochaeta sp. 2T2.1]|nr:hypothetical protein GE09DRAFT_588733 [Coniochaeta sp. 2T2.1]
MDTPSQVFADYLAIDGDRYDGWRRTTLDRSIPMFADRVVSRDAPFPVASKVDLSGLRRWEATEVATESAEPALLQQPMFVRAGLYMEEVRDTTMSLRSRASTTPSITPELMRSGRPSLSLKSTAGLKADVSGSSNWLGASTYFTRPDPEAPKKRTGSKKIKKEASEQDDKRGKYREGNRIAASKCREKKKQFVLELAEMKITLEHQQRQLEVEYNTLVAEVRRLKHELMLHAKCNDANIDTWISNEARKFVQTSELFGRQRAAVYRPLGD